MLRRWKEEKGKGEEWREIRKEPKMPRLKKPNRRNCDRKENVIEDVKRDD